MDLVIVSKYKIRIIFLTGFLAILIGCEKENLTNSNNFNIVGETIALSREETSYLIKKDANINKVYKINKDGTRTVFKAGLDYLKVTNGGLKRTSKSSIPDFSSHKMNLKNDGKFVWSPEPNRNPQLSLHFQVMVDYSSQIDNTISPSSNLLSNDLKNKLKNKEDISIKLVGTSISSGAHTLPDYYNGSDKAVYAHLIGKIINSLYGNQVSVKNLSRSGANTDLFISKIDSLILQKPDILFVEFGMNSHLDISTMNKSLSDIEEGIKSLVSNGINCVLIGFFQQNTYWELEDVNSTIYFNNELKKIAYRNNVFFSDIYTQFNLFSEKKIIRDLMGDYHHHPTDFGHKLYALKTIPIFLFNEKKESELLSFLDF